MPLSKEKRKEVDARRRKIQKAYGRGDSLVKIADSLKLGWNTNRLLREIHLMRKAGWELPYRYDDERRKKMGQRRTDQDAEPQEAA